MAVSDAWDLSLNGRGYQLDRKSNAYRHQSVPAIRQQSDTSNRPGEASLNPAGLWRRSQESWHHGAGQDWLDRDGSDPFRFRTSRGLDPWTKYQLTPLPETTKSDASATSHLYLTVANGRLYMTNGTGIRVTGTGTSVWANATGLPGGTVDSICSDGKTAYAAVGTFSATDQGVWSSSGTAFTQFVTDGVYSLVRFAKGRLIGAASVAAGPTKLYDVIATGASPTALYQHPNASWVWTDIGEGPNHILCAGFAGDKSAVYKTAVQADGTALEVPTVAVVMPDGEIVRSVTGYLGFVLLGTDSGIRFAVSDADGNLTLGARIDTPSVVWAAEGQGRFVWYSLSNYDDTHTGLGRLDLTAFTGDLTPAYSSDLMTPTAAALNGSVVSVATYLGQRWFTVAGDGVWTHHATDKVTDGEVFSGLFGWGLPDNKTVVKASILQDPVAVGTDVFDGSSVITDATTAYAEGTPTPLVDRSHEIRVLLQDADAVLRRVTLYATPNPDRTVMLQVPLLLADVIDDETGVVERPVDCEAEVAAIEALFNNGTVVPYIRRGRTRQVVVDDFTFVPENRSDRPTGETGTLLVTLKVVGEGA